MYFKQVQLAVFMERVPFYWPIKKQLSQTDLLQDMQG